MGCTSSVLGPPQRSQCGRPASSRATARSHRGLSRSPLVQRWDARPRHCHCASEPSPRTRQPARTRRPSPAASPASGVGRPKSTGIPSSRTTGKNHHLTREPSPTHSLRFWTARINIDVHFRSAHIGESGVSVLAHQQLSATTGLICRICSYRKPDVGASVPGCAGRTRVCRER